MLNYCYYKYHYQSKVSFESHMNVYLKYLDKNRKNFSDGLKNVKNLKLFKLESTYLAWVDCSALNINEDQLKKLFVQDAKVVPSFGYNFGKTGKSFVRLNLACRNEILNMAVDRIKNTFS